MAYLLDIAVILIVAASVLIGLKRGFLKSVVGLVGLFASLLLAFFLSGAIANGVFSAFIRPQTERAIATGIGSAAASTASVEENLQNAVDHLPNVVQKFMDSRGISPVGLADKVKEQSGNTAQAVAVTVTDVMVRPVMTLFVRCLAFLTLFVALLIVTGILGRLVCRLFRYTPFDGLNRALGAALGLVKGALWVLMFVTVIQVIASFTADTAAISQKTVEDTAIVEAIADVNPLVSTRDALMDQLDGLLK